MLRVAGAVEVLVGVALVLCNRGVGRAVRKAQQSLWDLGPSYQADTPNRVACVIVGVLLIVCGLLSLAGLTRRR